MAKGDKKHREGNIKIAKTVIFDLVPQNFRNFFSFSSSPKDMRINGWMLPFKLKEFVTCLGNFQNYVMCRGLLATNKIHNFGSQQNLVVIIKN
jgi:hypothetical protein